MSVTSAILAQTNDNQQLSIDESLFDPVGIQPHEFIQTLFGKIKTGFVEVVYLAPEGVKLYPHTYVQWADLPLKDIDPELPAIKALNQKGYSCYFGCAVKSITHPQEKRVSEKTGEIYTYYPRAKAADALCLTVLWADIDEPGQSGYKRAISMDLPPSIVVSSGGGYHAYWLLNKPVFVTDDNRDTIKRTLKGIAIACGSDSKVADLARIMRLPGTVNTKPGRGSLCEVIDFIPAYFDYADFEKRYAPLAAPPRPMVQREIPASASAGIPKWVNDYLDSGAVRGERNQTAFRAACRLFDNGFNYGDVERMVGNRALSDGLDDHEIAALIRSASNSNRNTPNMPRHMQERMATADHVIRERN